MTQFYEGLRELLVSPKKTYVPLLYHTSKGAHFMRIPKAKVMNII